MPFGISIGTGGSGSTIRGLVLTGPFDYTVTSDFSDGNVVAGCFIGTNAAGTAVVPGGARGLYVNGSDDFRVGGPAPADRNLIAGHSQFNVAVQNGSLDAVVQANLIGTNAAASALIGGPTLSSILLGSNTPGAVVRGNVIGGAGQGIQVGSVSGPGHGATIEGNWIGTDVSGTLNLGNTGNGILAQGQQAVIGGVGAGEGNVIAFNGGAGVYIDYSTINIEKNPIRGNSIYGNGTANGAGGRSTLGIDLGNQTGAGLTLNDDQDADAGPNTNQNFPLIASAVSGGGDTTVEGSFNSTPSTTFTIDFYSNSACLGRPQGFIQGRTYLGSAQVTTNGSGNAAIDVVLDGVTLEVGDVVTATATDPDGNTSEFSQRIVVSSTPGSGPATGAGISLSGFNFLAGATVTVGGVPATNVNVVGFNQITATTPSLPPGSLNSITVTNTDATTGTLPNGWIADFLDVPGGASVLLVRHHARAQRDHGRRRRRQLRRRAEHAAPADGGLPAQGQVRHLLHAAALHRAGFPRRALRLPLRPVDQRARRAGHHRRLRRRQLLSHQPRQPPANGGLSPEGLRRQRLYPARLHRGDVHGRAVLAPVRSLDL